MVITNIKIAAQSRWKVNASSIVLTIPHIAYEKKITTKFSYQTDLLISPWRSFFGRDMLFAIYSNEVRYYPKGVFNGFYLAPNLSLGFFHWQKWNYWNTTTTQKGFNYIMGLTAGYQYQYNKKLAIDLFAGAGNSQGFYKSYNKNTNIRVDSATHFNKSGEWIPYRIGIMLSYQIK